MRRWVLTLGCLVGIWGAGAAWAADAMQRELKVSHSPPPYYVARHRFRLTATARYPAGLQEARCYFKEQSSANYVYALMTQPPGETEVFAAVLPAMDSDSNQLEYYLLFETGEGGIARTQEYKVPIRYRATPPAWQDVPGVAMEIYTDDPEEPRDIPGVRDDLACRVVPEARRLTRSGQGIPQVKAGQPLSKKQWAVIGAGAAALAGGAALALSGGGGGGGGTVVTQTVTVSSGGGGSPSTSSSGNVSASILVDVLTAGDGDRVTVVLDGRTLGSSGPSGTFSWSGMVSRGAHELDIYPKYGSDGTIDFCVIKNGSTQDCVSSFGYARYDATLWF